MTRFSTLLPIAAADNPRAVHPCPGSDSKIGMGLEALRYWNQPVRVGT